MEMGKQKGSFLSLLSEKVTELVVHLEKLGVEVDKPKKHQTQEKGEQIGSFPVTEPERGSFLQVKRGEKTISEGNQRNGKAGWSDETALFWRQG